MPIPSAYPRTDSEIKAAVTPAAYTYAPGDVRRYGAVGDGISDDTLCVNAAIAQHNDGGLPVRGTEGSIYLCSPLSPITRTDAVLESLSLKVKPDSWSNAGDGSTQLLISGERAALRNVVIDGNQAAFHRQPGTGRLLQFGNDCYFSNVTVKNSPHVGARSGAARARFVGCHFDDNANLGMELAAASDFLFQITSFNRNGYGFQRTFATNAFAAFGIAVRYRSHHIFFIGCEGNENGRDGININQGSYAVKHLGCTTSRNGDGGLTIAADNASTATAGEGESPHDIEYIECESSNNWNSGLVSFQSVFNLSVIGGRYYNNHRLAGQLPNQSSYYNGIYIAAGSKGVNIRTQAFDDRQIAVITAISGSDRSRSLAAKGWVAGTCNEYPRVALYDARRIFKGYGTITAEIAGVVTIQSTSNDGVDLAAIRKGWCVTQRVQHNGVFFDNDCQGYGDVEGFGHLPRVETYTGHTVISGWFANGQNVEIKGTLEAVELIPNPSWDVDESSWVYNTPAGGSHARSVSAPKRSIAKQMLVGGATAQSEADAVLGRSALGHVKGAFVEYSVWAYADGAGDCSAALFWNPGGAGVFTTSVSHPGGGWKKLAINAYIPRDANQLIPRVVAAKGKSISFDDASLRVRTPAPGHSEQTGVHEPEH